MNSNHCFCQIPNSIFGPYETTVSRWKPKNIFRLAKTAIVSQKYVPSIGKIMGKDTKRD